MEFLFALNLRIFSSKSFKSLCANLTNFDLAAGALKALQKIEANKKWGTDLLISAQKWKAGIIKNSSYPIHGDAHILSIIIGEEEKALALQKYLEINGFLAIAIRPPTVPVGGSRIRITISKNLDLQILTKFISVLKDFK